VEDPTPAVAIERRGHVAVLRFDRPPVNALDLAAARVLAGAFAEATADDETRAIVITGTGDCFCAGLDLKAVPAYGAADLRAMVGEVNAMIARLYGCPKPTVAAVNGHAIAGGLVLALACDRRIGRRRGYRMGLTEARVGIPFPFGPLTVVRSELDPSVARSLMLLGRNLDDPQDAVRAGILDELAPRRRLLDRAVEVAEDLASMPHEGYARIKRQLRGEAVARIEDAVARGTDPLLEEWLTGETAAASRAVLTRERPT
jgi:enoyl-CoA hydratase/carnithine racemase